MSFKVLDLRVGTYLQQEDIYGRIFDAIYQSRYDAEASIQDVCNFDKYIAHEKLRPYYFEVIEL